MTKVSAEDKERLVAEGRWEDFLRCRENLRKEGIGKADSTRLALERFGEGSDDVSMVSVDKPKESVDASVFDGKRCSMVDSVLWVIENYGVSDVSASDAPSAAAWTILNACRRSPVFFEDLLGKVVVKMIPSKIEDTSGSDDRFDGSEEYDLLGAIAEALK